MSYSTENVAKKNCIYNGQLYVELNEKQFKFYPKSGIRQCAIFYDVSGEDKLSLKIKRSVDSQSNIRITLFKTDRLFSKEEIIEIVMITPLLMMDTLKEDYHMFKKSLQMFGDYTVTGRGKVIDTIFTHADGTEYQVFVNGQSRIYDTYHWLCSIWTPRCECTEYYISTIDGLIEESRTFVSCSLGRTVVFSVAEKCYAHSIAENSPPLILPWNRMSLVLLRVLSEMLSLCEDEVRLLDGKGSALRGSLKLDIGNFRGKDGREPPMVWYDVSKTLIKCTSIRDKHDSIQLAILNDFSASEMKIKLAKSLGKDPRIFIVSQNTKLLANDDIISPLKEVEYCTGETLDDITLKGQIGQGGFGEVFKCVVKSSSKVRAMKKFTIPLSDDTKRIGLVREIVVIFNVPRHDNLVEYYDIYVDNIDIYIGMEYMSGGSLKKYIDSNGALDSDRIKKWGREMVRGLEHLHKNHVNHRDIKGDNVLLSEHNIAKLCDFGISTILPDCKTKGVAIQTKMFGTTRYMAPEVVNGDAYAFMADIWSVGATIVEMITGKVPHHEIEDQALVYHIGKERTINYTAPDPDSFPDSLKELVDCCLSPEAKDRPSASKLLEFSFLKD